MAGTRWILVVSLLIRTDAPALASEKPRLAVVDRKLTRAVHRAIEDAHDKLSRPECQKVLGDFRDRTGRTLEENLGSLGQTAPGYLGWLVFYNGSNQPFCDDRDVHAVTVPGSRIIYICERQFRERVQSDAGLAAAYVIHELLHSLGLGENPPTPADITRQVVARCGR
jgi:hypothetical protein